MLSRGFITRVVLSVAASCILHAVPASAQSPVAQEARNSWELLFSSGALVPAGAQRDFIKDANLSTAQLSYVIRSRYALTTMFGWARSRDLGSVAAPKLDVFTYDVGAEARAPRWIGGESVSFTPFIGAGAGSRSYNYRSLDVAARHNLAGYAAIGGELGRSRLRVRLEVRDYVTGFKPLVGSGSAGTRNEVVAFVGLRLARRGS